MKIPSLKTLSFTQLYPNLLLLLIIVFGFLIRSYHLTEAPRGALIDELHFGYLAHSLLETGADEHGERYPIIFRGFGDQKLPAYAYATMPFIAFFGLEIVAFRAVSLIAGTALIIAMYWLSLEMGVQKKWAIGVAFLTAVSPWSFFLSRIGFESNLALVLYTFGLAALLKGVRISHAGWLIGGTLAFAATWYSYIAYRPITLVLLCLVFAAGWWRKQLNLRQISIAFLSFIVVVAVLFTPAAVGANSTRLKQVGIFSDAGITLTVDENRTFCDMQLPRLVCDVAFNKVVLTTRMLLSRYLEVFSPQFLATRGEEDITFLTVENFGQIYPIMYPFFLLGLIALAVRYPSKQSFSALALLLAGLLVAPLPTILVGDAQKVRISALLPFIFVLTGIGLSYAEHLIQHQSVKKIFTYCIILGTLSFSYLYFVEYFSVHVVNNEQHYQSYLPELYSFIETLGPETHVTIKPFYSDPLMFYAFYTKMDPREYQQIAVLGEQESSGFQHTVGLGKITARDHSLGHVGCEGHIGGYQSVLVTNEAIAGAQVLYEGRSTNGVHPYVFAYDATGSTPKESCSR